MSLGHTRWALAAGHVPFGTTGPEPEFTSHDALFVLNAGEVEAEVRLTVYLADRDPLGPFRLRVGAQRVRSVRINDLIDPLPVPLDVDYALVVEASVPVVVQFSRQDTRQAALAVATTMAFPLD